MRKWRKEKYEEHIEIEQDIGIYRNLPFLGAPGQSDHDVRLDDSYLVSSRSRDGDRQAFHLSASVLSHRHINGRATF